MLQPSPGTCSRHFSTGRESGETNRIIKAKLWVLFCESLSAAHLVLSGTVSQHSHVVAALKFYFGLAKKSEKVTTLILCQMQAGRQLTKKVNSEKHEVFQEHKVSQVAQ